MDCPVQSRMGLNKSMGQKLVLETFAILLPHSQLQKLQLATAAAIGPPAPMGVDCTCCPWDLCYCPLNAGRRHTDTHNPRLTCAHMRAHLHALVHKQDTHNPRLHAHAHRQPSVCASKRSLMYKITSGCSAA